MRCDRSSLAIGLALVVSLLPWLARTSAAQGSSAFKVSFPASAHQQPLTGRLLLIVSRKNDPELRHQTGWVNSPPIFGMDVNQLKPGQEVVIDRTTAGFPLKSIGEVPPDDYFVQALLNVYTEFHRSDGHVIWAHMDQWEG
jgi:hypothetical protein